jgi:hypothetical protein
LQRLAAHRLYHFGELIKLLRARNSVGVCAAI